MARKTSTTRTAPLPGHTTSSFRFALLKKHNFVPDLICDPTQGEEQSRQEEQDEDGLVTGSYSYLGADGVQHTVNYRAGAGIGFEIIDPSVDQMFADFGAKVDEPLPVAAIRDAAPAVVVEAPAVAPDALYGAPAAVAPDTLYGAPAEELPSYSE